MPRHLKKTYKQSKKRYNRKTRRLYRKSKKGGMAPPIRDAAKYSYPPYFPNKGVEGKDVWPVKFQAPNVKDVDVPTLNQFPLGENVIIDIKEQEGDNNLMNQSGGYVYDPKFKKMHSKRQLKAFRPVFKKIGRK